MGNGFIINEFLFFLFYFIFKFVISDWDVIESNLEYAIFEVNAELGGGGLNEVVLGVKV